MSVKRVLLITKIEPVLSDFLLEKGYTLEEGFSLDYEQLSQCIQDYTGIITSTKIKFDQPLLEKAENLHWIGRMGSGMEHIDVAYAKSRNIICISSPEGNANAVAEQALGMYLALQHRIVKSHTELRQDIWLRDANRGFEIEGTTAGIIGMGNNGYRFAQKLTAMGVKVLGFDIETKDYPPNPGIIWCTDLEQIYQEATMISFHVPYTKATHHYFNQEFCNRMQHPFTLLNLSRGEVAEQYAVYDGLLRGKIVGAALDVWEKEPISKMDDKMFAIAMEMLHMPNFIGTAHIGGYTYDANTKMCLTLKKKLGFII
ncbi:NAD(P)-dependent oxidoreductase [Edaphocola flava]|uniref:NAD(P)-dependent oxidoreductase n=1 Tax=Edaphocola flava TaxID=2499629 RepID=UPI00100A3CB3|nr:NAD(P)-dependent oxidoreductase [Edaphocola flava]